MGDDLEGRVPAAGMADCQLGKAEVPLRIRLKRQGEEDKGIRKSLGSLGSLWEEGEKEREREREIERDRERKREREASEKVGVGD